MITDKHVNDVTTEDLDGRFATRDWAEAGGNIQSLLFAQGFAQLGWPLGVNIARAVIHDYGCAEGDGTAFIQAQYPLAQVVGFDLSPVAVARATERWPTVSGFRVGNVLEPQEECDIAYTSHCLEHLEDPVVGVRALQRVARLVVVIVPPTEGGDKDTTHKGTRPYMEWVQEIVPDLILHGKYTIHRIHPTLKQVITEESMAHLIRGRR